MEEEEDDQEYELTAFLYVITFPASEDEPERHVFCVNWNHEITISWTTGDYPEALRELIDEGSYWIENGNCEDDAQEDNGKMPPYDFCFDLKTDLPMEGFPLVVTREYKAEWKKEWKQKRRNNHYVNARRKTDDADEVFVVADDVEICVGEVGDEDLDVQEEEEEEVVVVESENTAFGRKRARPSGAQEEEERFAAAQTQEFLDTEAKDLLRSQILDEIRKRCVDTFEYAVLICDKNANEEYLVYGFGICRACSSNVLCWKKAGLVVVSFDDWLAKARGSAFRAGGFRDHICRPVKRAGSADHNTSRSSARVQGRSLGPEEVADLITNRYGLFLGKLNPQAFKDASHRKRHISAAKKLIPTMFSIPSFLSRLKVPMCLFSIFLLSLFDLIN